MTRATPKQKSILFNDSEVTYYQYYHNTPTHTTGQALIFIHGWTCSSTLWTCQSPLLATYPSILIDLPGHGASSPPALPFSLELFARSILAVLEAENVKKAILIGHSMGGPVCTMFLRLFPSIVSGIIYIDSFFNLPQSRLNITDRQILRENLQNDEFFNSQVEALLSHGSKTTPEIKTMVKDVMFATSTYTRANATTTDVLPHLWRADEVFDIPALHVLGPMRKHFDHRWMYYLPRLDTSPWEDFGHFPFLEDPVRFNDEVVEFLERHKLFG